ncbi:PREDICTED: uncharacterized protein LOC108354765, partial [Rhagoletis zephyria]|uniref:uncharacterized protein LOC108354765 n=1 Tax=Rhagoletis zephyria TaxID=28612 RepID=UPI0008114AB0
MQPSQHRTQIATTAVPAATAPEDSVCQRSEAITQNTFASSANLPTQESVVQTLLKQIASLECQLKSVQVRAKESDSQCLALREALQQRTSKDDTTAISYAVPSTSAITGSVGCYIEGANNTMMPRPDNEASTALYSSLTTNTVSASHGFPAMTHQAATFKVPYINNRSATYEAVTPVFTSAANSSAVVASSMAVPVTQPSSSNAGLSDFQPISGIHQRARVTSEHPPSCSLLLPTRAPFASSSASPLPDAGMPGITPTFNNVLHGNTALAPRKLQDLPEFNGHPEDWPLFHTAFIQSTAVYGYTNLENNQRLQKSLKGEARDTVQALLIHPDNVNAIIEQLRFRFGRPEQLIRSQLSIIKDIPSVPESNLVKLIPFATKVQNLVAFLKSANGHQHLVNPTLMEELVNKLPMSKRIEWARFASVIQPYATIVHFSEWLTQTANLICTVQSFDSKETIKRRVVLYATENQREKHSTPTLKCVICQHGHKLADCQRFIKMTVPDRWTEAKRHHLCFSCLHAGHSTRDCRRRKTCTLDGCKRVHHKLLHDSTQKSAPVPEPSPALADLPNQGNKQSVLSCSNNLVKNKLLFRILPVTLYGKDKSVNTYALLDEGSSVTLIDSALVQELGLRGHQRKLHVQWFGGRAAEKLSQVVNLFISGTGMEKRHHLRNVHSVSNLCLPSQSVSKEDLKSLTHMRQLPLDPYSGAVPKLLLGLDHCHLGLPTEVLRIHCTGPYAANTELGWTVFGPTVNAQPKVQRCLLVKQTSDQDLHDLVADYFTIESFGVKPAPPVESANDTRAKAILHTTTRRVNGRYETGLLWRSDDIILPESYSMAYRRLLGIERKMQRDSTFAESYKEIMNSYIVKDYARKLQPEEISSVQNKTWYLPHFDVVNPNKPRKLRLVFDAAAVAHGVSLNAHLLKGP